MNNTQTPLPEPLPVHSIHGYGTKSRTLYGRTYIEEIFLHDGAVLSEGNDVSKMHTALDEIEQSIVKRRFGGE